MIRARPFGLLDSYQSPFEAGVHNKFVQKYKGGDNEAVGFRNWPSNC